MARRQYKGNAVPTTLSAGIDASVTSFNIASTTGWPDGSIGPFFVVVDRGLSGQEVMLVTSRSGSTLNGVTRAQADTTAASHSLGAAIEHVGTKVDLDEANLHVNDGEADPHATKLLNNTRHDVTARHTVGSVLPASTTATDLGTSAGGAANNLSRGDHVHSISAWSTYSPTPSGFTVGNGTLTARYKLVGKQLLGLHIVFIAGSTSSFSGVWSVTLPPGVSVNQNTYIPALVILGSHPLAGLAWLSTTSVFAVYVPDDNAVDTEMGLLSDTHPQAWVAGDTVTINIGVEVA